MLVMLVLPNYLFQQEITEPISFLGYKYLSFPSRPQVHFAQRRLARVACWGGQWTPIFWPRSRLFHLVRCLVHLSPLRVPRPPVTMGPWYQEDYAAKTHHPPRPDLHLTTGLSAASLGALVSHLLKQKRWSLVHLQDCWVFWYYRDRRPRRRLYIEKKLVVCGITTSVSIRRYLQTENRSHQRYVKTPEWLYLTCKSKCFPILGQATAAKTSNQTSHVEWEKSISWGTLNIFIYIYIWV